MKDVSTQFSGARQRSIMYSVAVLLSASVFGLGCGTTQSSVPPKPAKGAASKTSAPVRPADLSGRGRRVQSGAWVKLMGYNTVWVDGTVVLITLKKTAWDEIEGAREGRATLVIEAGAEKKTIVMREGQSREVAGIQLELKTAHEAYNDGRYEPFVEFKVVSR